MLEVFVIVEVDLFHLTQTLDFDLIIRTIAPTLDPWVACIVLKLFLKCLRKKLTSISIAFTLLQDITPEFEGTVSAVWRYFLVSFAHQYSRAHQNFLLPSATSTGRKALLHHMNLIQLRWSLRIGRPGVLHLTNLTLDLLAGAGVLHLTNLILNLLALTIGLYIHLLRGWVWVTMMIGRGGLFSLENLRKQRLPSGWKDRGDLAPRGARVVVYTSQMGKERMFTLGIHVWGTLAINSGGNLVREATMGIVVLWTFKARCLRIQAKEYDRIVLESHWFCCIIWIYVSWWFNSLIIICSYDFPYG